MRIAVRMDQRLLDPDGPPAWVWLVLVPPEVAPLFDDPAVSQALRRVLAGPGMFGPVAPPAGPAIQRYSGKPWPVAGFHTR